MDHSRISKEKGSSSWITDAGGQALQHFMYLPFGEPWIDQQNSGFHTYFTFSGKERDVETGYGYFGARYYSSDLGIWISVDPMAGKYPHVTNYVYCSNNPLKIIDPNGMDEWEFDKCGKLINTIKNDQEDRFHVLNENGERTASSGSFEANTFTKLNDEEGLTLFGVGQEGAGEEAFTFLADNTDVEWENVGTDKGQFLGSSQEESMGYIGGTLKSEGHTITSHDHNHPGGSDAVSEADHNFATTVQTVNPTATLRHYTRSNGFKSYDGFSPYISKDGKFKQNLSPVQIIFKKPEKP